MKSDSNRITLTAQIFTGKGAPTTIQASYPIESETDLGKVLRFGIAKFIEEKVPVKHRENLRHD